MDAIGRACSAAKWLTRLRTADSIGADAVTADLRTAKNALSFWRCAPDRVGATDVALAIAATRDRIQRIDVVLVPMAALAEHDLPWRETPGRTPITDLRARHVDLVDLDLDRLGALARLVRDSVRTTRLLFRFEPAAVRAMLVGAAADGRAEIGAFAPTLREQL